MICSRAIRLALGLAFLPGISTAAFVDFTLDRSASVNSRALAAYDPGSFESTDQAGPFHSGPLTSQVAQDGDSVSITSNLSSNLTAERDLISITSTSRSSLSFNRKAGDLIDFYDNTGIGVSFRATSKFTCTLKYSGKRAGSDAGSPYVQILQSTDGGLLYPILFQSFSTGKSESFTKVLPPGLYEISVATFLQGNATDISPTSGSGTWGLDFSFSAKPYVPPPRVVLKGPARITTTKSPVTLHGTVTSSAGGLTLQYRVGGKGSFRTAKIRNGTWSITVPAPRGKGVRVDIRAFDGASYSPMLRVLVLRSK